MTAMRAKMRISHIEVYANQEGDPTQETMNFQAVSRSDGYPADGSDEDNTYAKFSPSGNLSLTVANPALLGKFKVGEKYYLDFTRAA